MEEKQLLNAISDLMDEKLQPVKVNIRELKEDAGVLKQDVSGLKEDVGVLKQDVSDLKEDVGVLKQDVSGLKEDVGVLKQDVSGLKEDVGVLKQDVSGLKEDVGVLKQEVSVLKKDVGGLKEDVEKLSEKQVIMEGKMDVMAQNVNNIEFILENKVYHEIHLVAESHFFLKRKLDYIETTLKRHSDIPMKVSYLYYEVQQIKRKMAE